MNKEQGMLKLNNEQGTIKLNDEVFIDRSFLSSEDTIRPPASELSLIWILNKEQGMLKLNNEQGTRNFEIE